MRGGKSRGKKARKAALEASTRVQPTPTNLSKPTRTARSNGKKVKRETHATNLLRKIQNTEKRLAELRSLHTTANDPLISSQIGKLERVLAKRVISLHNLERLGALDIKQQFGTQVGPLDQDDLDQEGELLGNKQLHHSKKRKFSQAAGLGGDDHEDIDQSRIAPEVIVLDGTPKKIKREKRDKRDKKKRRKIDVSSTDFSPLLDSVPGFQEPEIEEPAVSNETNSNKTKILDRRASKYAIQDISIPPTPEQAKKSALLKTITRDRERSQSIGGDKIYEELLASMLDIPSPPIFQNPVNEHHNSLIEIGKSAIAAPILPNKQKPIRDRAFVAQAPAAKVDINVVHRESPILPPKRNFSSSTRIVPHSKKVPDEKENKEKEKIKEKKKRKEKESSKKSRKSSSSKFKFTEESQESESLSQTVTAIKEAASATVIEGNFSQNQPDSFASTARILPPIKPGVARKLTYANDIEPSTPVTTPTKPKSKGRRGKSGKNIEGRGEGEDWELKSGLVRARTVKQNGEDNEEIEENVAFSAKYLSAHPLGVTISNTRFQILHIAAGTDEHLTFTNKEKDKTKGKPKDSLKICSVAKGHVHVTLGKETFAVSENGMWRVRWGEKCVVRSLVEDGDGGACVHVFGVET